MTGEIKTTSSKLLQSKRTMPEWAEDYLEALEQTSGVKTKAAKLINLSYSAVYKATLSYPEFGQAVDDLKAEWDSRNLAALEEVSMIQAMKPGNVTERIFNLKALNPRKYREKTVPEHPGNIVIHFGASIGNEPPETFVFGPNGKNLTEIPARAEIKDVSSTPTKRRLPASDILCEEDVNV